MATLRSKTFFIQQVLPYQLDLQVQPIIIGQQEVH